MGRRRNLKRDTHKKITKANHGSRPGRSGTNRSRKSLAEQKKYSS